MAQQEEKKMNVPEETDKKTLKLLDLVESALRNGQKLNFVPDGICGRIQKYTEKDKKNIKQLARSYKLFAWIFGGDGIYELSLKSNIAKLEYLGYTNDWIKKQITNNNAKFRFMLFSSNNNDAYSATWNNVFLLLKKYVNNAYIRLEKYIQLLQNTPFNTIEQEAGFSFLEIHLLGAQNSDKFMSLERFTSIDIEKVTLIDCRLFLYNWLGLKGLYSGDGYTQKEDNKGQNNGDKGCLEYLMPNKFIKDIYELRMIEFDIDLSEVTNVDQLTN
eukprot:283013_1